MIGLGKVKCNSETAGFAKRDGFAGRQDADLASTSFTLLPNSVGLWRMENVGHDIKKKVRVEECDALQSWSM